MKENLFVAAIFTNAALRYVCKDIVAHVKRSRIQAKLDTTLKTAVPTRWNSVLIMLQSVLNNAADLKKLADEFSDKKTAAFIAGHQLGALEADCGRSTTI